MNNSTRTEQLIRLLDNELSDPERVELETLLAEDVSLAEELDRLRIARNLVQGFALREQVASIHTEMMEEVRMESSPQAATRTPVRPLNRLVLQVAASILVILSVTLFYQYLTLSPQKIFTDSYSPYQPTTNRGIESSPITSLFMEHKFQEVVQKFGTLTSPTQEELFLAGNAYLELNQLPRAISTFQQLQAENIARGSLLFKDDADYYLAMSYLRNNETNRALPILEAIHNNPDHAYHDKVSAWQLRKLNWVRRGD